MSKSKRQPRGAAETSLEELLKFERLLADLSVRFANVSGDEVELEIEIALKHLLKFLDFDRGSFGEFAANGWVTVICSVAREGVDRYPQVAGDFRELVSRSAPCGKNRTRAIDR